METCKPCVVMDTEIFSNRFLFKCREVGSDKMVSVWMHDKDYIQIIDSVIKSNITFVTFNGNKFDWPVIGAVLAGRSVQEVKAIANAIIEHEMQPWEVERRFGIKVPRVDTIDLIEVSPGFVGLKSYGARMHMPWLKDLPFPHDAELDLEQCEIVDKYCENDLDTTEELFNRLEQPLLIRVAMSSEYGVDMRSKSDTQMAETAFIKRLNLSRNKAKVPATITYTVPNYINFKSPHLIELTRRIGETVYNVNPKTGHVELPDFLGKEIVTLNNGTYQLGVGGIHSTHDKKVCHVASADTVITDIDAASYYPSILINANMIPQNTGQAFIDEYKEIYHRRLAAKKRGDKVLAETLKISLNGTFGKTASRWSPLYSPDLMLAITLTGQLTLLNLIEELEEVGAVALSANTDGIAMAYPAEIKERVESVVSAFSERSQFEFEYTPYRVLALKDVNNYLAVKTDRKIKAKGIYAPPDLRKNPTASICAKAVGLWLAHGTSFEETIKSGTLEEFISARNVTGGGVQGGEFLGKVVRWYMSTEDALPPLSYAKNGNKVPKTDGARACMVIDKNGPLPSDLDYNWYIKEAIRIACDLGCKDYLTEEQTALVTPPPKVRKPRAKKES